MMTAVKNNNALFISKFEFFIASAYYCKGELFLKSDETGC